MYRNSPRLKCNLTWYDLKGSAVFRRCLSVARYFPLRLSTLVRIVSILRKARRWLWFVAIGRFWKSADEDIKFACCGCGFGTSKLFSRRGISAAVVWDFSTMEDVVEQYRRLALEKENSTLNFDDEEEEEATVPKANVAEFRWWSHPHRPESQISVSTGTVCIALGARKRNGVSRN
ncbi:unnamed protein product [Cuscuta epithymum]|uniref:Uncharacterized protein n=1 Tax=Cuscuta epithymum TaxID=186058 RepID=A0AAV0DNW3_9ASTE|nr:unnamed protein product [Cuscuta epithymum]